MSDSILQVNLIKNKGGSATGITIDNSNANVTIGNLTQTAGTIGNAVIQKVHSFSAYVSSQVQMSSDNTWYEVSTLGTWTERWDSGQYASGKFTPTKSGIYLCGYSVACDQIDDGEYLRVEMRKNGSTSAGDVYGGEEVRGSVNSDMALRLSGSSLLTLNGSGDYVSLWSAHNQGQSATYLDINLTEFWATYMGEI